MRKEIFSQCRMTFCEGITSIDAKLFGAVTQIGFKITSVSPLIVESNSTSKEELLKLADVLTPSSEPQGSSSNAASSNSCFLLSKCQLTVSEDIKSIDLTLFNAVTQAGFKIIRVDPLAIEKDSTSREDLVRLADLLTSNDDIQECSTNAAVTGAGSSSNKGHEQEEDTSGSTTEKSNSAYKVNIPEPEVEDYVMKKHHFHLLGKYYFDQDWKELFGKAEETDEGFRFQMKDVSAEEYGILQRLKKIAFETIGILDNEAHRVKEAAEHINCVDHGVCVIDYNSRPYIVGPKAQVHAAREEILYKLREDGVDCHLTSLKTLTTQNDSEDMDTNINNSDVYNKSNAGIDRESTSSSETESDAESDTVEYIVGKNDFRLAKQYFEGRPEHQYFDKAAKRKGGYLFSFSSQATDCTLFIRTLRRLNFEAVSHRENDKLKVRSIADQLKCGDLDVKVLEKGSTLFLVGRKEKVAEVKQKIISKLQDTDEDSKDMKIREKSKRQGSQSDSAPCQYMPSSQPGVSQQTEAASIFPQASNARCVTGIKDNDHEENIGKMSFKAQTMPEVKNPRGYEDSNGGFGVEDEDKVKDITSSNTGHGMGSNESMDEYDISDVDSLGSDIDKHTPLNSGTKVIGCDAGKSESKEQMFATQELVEGIGQVQGPPSITNQHAGIEYSENSDVPQMTFRHEPVVNQDVTSDVKITPVDRSKIITDNRGNLSEVELNEASAVMKVKDDRNAAGDDQRDNLHHVGQQARKVQGQHQVGEPNQQRGYTSDEGDKHERELSHGVQIRQNRPSEDTQQVSPEISLGRPGEQVVELEEERAKRQTEAKHHSDDTEMMEDRDKQSYDQDRLDRIQPDTDSDEKSGSIEYVRMKTLIRLAKQYFKGCIDHRYFDEAEISEIRFLISTNNKNTEQARIMKALGKLKFEIVGDVEDVKPQLKKMADQLKCTDSTVKLLQLGSKSYLVGPEKNIARVKQEFISHISTRNC